MAIPDKLRVFWFLPTRGNGRFLGSAEAGRKGDLARLKRMAPATDWLCTVAAFAVVLGLVFGAGSDRRPAANGAPDAGDGPRHTASLLSAQGSP